jgi:membrane-associated phospholipid phosphatase
VGSAVVFRLRGLSAWIRELAGPAATDASAAITRLGDPLFLLLVLAVYYWLSAERDGAAQLVAVTLLAVAVTVTLKNGLALPRPPVEIQAVPTDGDSYGFPSGHALGATVVYGGLAVVDDRLRRMSATGVLALLVAHVGLSRVVIGVHYVGDVFAGFAVGGLLLALLWWSEPRHRPLVAGAATVAALPAVVVTGGGTDSTFVFGAALGATLVFSLVDVETLPDAPAVPQGAALVALGLVVLGGTYSLALAIGHPLAFAAGGVVILAGSLVLPRALQVTQAALPAAD